MASDHDLPPDHATSLEAQRRVLWALAYRLTGSGADAEDVVQDAFERALRSPPRDLERPLEPWLVRVTTNLSLDALRRRKRLHYAGAWLPEPACIDESASALRSTSDVESRYAWVESLSYAFLLALEALDPVPRAVLVLRDVLAHSAREVADLLDLSEGNVRVILHRARKALQAYDRSRIPPSHVHEAETRKSLERLLRCLLSGDVEGLESLLAEDVRTVTDGGNRHTALHAPMVGRAAVSRFYLRVTSRRGTGAAVTPLRANGMPALLVEFARTERRQAPCALLRCELGPCGRIREIHAILGREKLRSLVGV